MSDKPCTDCGDPAALAAQIEKSVKYIVSALRGTSALYVLAAAHVKNPVSMDACLTVARTYGELAGSIEANMLLLSFEEAPSVQG